MSKYKELQIASTLDHLFKDSRYDHLKMVKGVAMSLFRPMQPTDFEEVYLSISKEEGTSLKHLILEYDLKNIVEFGTSFGISTLYMAAAVLENGGHIISTELLASKATKAMENFKSAGVSELIEVRVGDAMKTLKYHDKPIDLLFLDGWKDLYLKLFQMLEPNFYAKTIIYVDNADMKEAKQFVKEIAKDDKYQLQSLYGGKAVLIKCVIKG